MSDEEEKSILEEIRDFLKSLWRDGYVEKDSVDEKTGEQRYKLTKKGADVLENERLRNSGRLN